jgi:hypothetical protein
VKRVSVTGSLRPPGSRERVSFALAPGQRKSDAHAGLRYRAMTEFARGIREEDDRPCHLEIFACFLRRTGGFHPMTTSALHGASVSFAIKKSARAETLAGRARAVGVTKYSPPSGKRQSVRSGYCAILRIRPAAASSGRPGEYRLPPAAAARPWPTLCACGAPADFL